MKPGCRALAQKESVLAGASSGGVIAAVKQMEQELLPESVCAVIVHDQGERYLDTVYSDAWIQSEFGKYISGTEKGGEHVVPKRPGHPGDRSWET